MSAETHRQTGAARPQRPASFWRLSGYLFLFMVVNLLANLARVGLQALGLSALAGRLVFAIVYIAGVLVLTHLYRHHVDRRPWSGIGLPPSSEHLPELAAGLALGLLLAAIVAGAEYAAGWIRISSFVDASLVLTWLVDSLFLSLGLGVCEEICFRGYLFQNLAEGRPIWQATWITGLIFGAFHLLTLGLGLRGLTFFVFILLLNVLLVLTRILAGSLWLAIGFHTAFDWMAINSGLGSVVLADERVLQVTRTLPLPAEDLLSALVVGLGILLLMNWVRRTGPRFSWRALLDDEGRLIPPAS